jgi:hypothetical protein
MAKSKVVHFYHNHPSIYDSECFYCGSFGQSKDHIPPISYPEYFEEEKRWIVRACLMCNGLLSNRPYLTFLSRYDFLLIRYRFKFRKLLTMPIWTYEEILDLQGKLKRTIILNQKKKKYIENKILFIEEKIKFLQGY